MGQKKQETRFNYAGGIAHKQTLYQHYLHGAFGNLHRITDPRGTPALLFYENNNFHAKKVYDDQQTVVIDTISGLTNYVVAPLTRRYPGTAAEDSLEIYRMVDDLGLPVHTIDANGVLYDYKFDKLGRISSVTYPHDFLAEETVEVDTTWNFDVGEWLQPRYSVKQLQWQYSNPQFQIYRQFVIETNYNEGYAQGLLYLKFNDLESFGISNIQSAKLRIFCHDVQLNTGAAPLFRVETVSQSWNSSYNGSLPPQLSGSVYTVFAAIDSGWNEIDLTPWFESWLSSPGMENGLCLYVVAGDSQSYVFHNLGILRAHLAVTATIAKPLETHYTFKQEYFDSQNRLVSRLRQERRGSGFQNIVASQSEALYDGLGRITQSRRYYDDTSFYADTPEYDYADQVIRAANARGNATEQEYDFLGRPSKTIFADDNFTRKGYSYTNTLSAAYSPESHSNHFLNEIPAGSFFAVDTTIDELGGANCPTPTRWATCARKSSIPAG